MLEDGARHWYHPEPALIAYYDLLARLLREEGRAEEAEQFAARRDEVKLAITRLAAARPVVHDAGIPEAITRSSP